MEIVLTNGETLKVCFMGDEECREPRRVRDKKGKSTIALPEEFIVLDLETTGLDPMYDDIIELAALRVRAGAVVDTFESLVKPHNEIDEFITALTGITNEMLETAPLPKDIFPAFRDFVGDDIVIGHNVNFDVNFLYDKFEDALNCTFENNFIDTMRLARKLLPELNHHRLCDIVLALGVSHENSHRALADCQATLDCYARLRSNALERYGSETEFTNQFKYNGTKLDLRNVSSNKTDFDETHPLYNKNCVFTGTLEKMTRKQAAQIVVDLGGRCENNITMKTNFLILGDNDYCKSIKDGKSNKQKKAEKYKLEGYDIEIIPENVFYDML